MAKNKFTKERSATRQPLKKRRSIYWLVLLVLAAIGIGLYKYPPPALVKYGRLKSLEHLAKEEKIYYYGLPGEPVNWPAGKVLRGVDVSRYQTHVKWSEVKKSHIAFVFIKATEGFYGRDRLYQRHWQRTEKVGLIRGAYHFYRANQPAWLQALNFITQVEIASGNLPPVLDVEQAGYATDEELRERVSTWLRWVEWRYGVKPIIYTNYNFYKDYFEGFFEEYPFWIAHYKVDKLKLTDYTRKQVKFWQHTDRGAVPGIEGRVDCNVFYGSKTALEQLCVE
ncbi:glycoside hydrolase family 25 protein [Adhaeribacter arboris]|uniref:glycoside hydrolase family 25 protein n=1 Tax=Adhaeribacter arboris TaxID=2072846 RepID=UPI001304A84C|nr:GH25 family lysozyme [Adhaeribacter arboris]